MVEEIRQGDIPGVQLRCRQPLEVPAATAWLWLSEPELLARWAGRARFEGGLKGALELEPGEEGEPVRERGRTLELAAGERWVLAFERLGDGWQTATRLTFELTRQEDGCELSVLQEGFEHLPLSRCLTIWEAYRRRWRRALADLAREIAARESGSANRE